MKALLRKIRQILKDRRTRRIFTRVVSGIAAFIVFVTTYALVLPAITMESEAACGIPAHQHDDSCYEEVLTCDLPESDGHTHDESCYTVTEELVCELEEHTHSTENGCYDEEGNLICELREHTHTDDCHKEEKTLSCGLEESEGHHHDASCYDKVLTCGLEAHVHSAECYQEDDSSNAVAASTGAASIEIENDGTGADDEAQTSDMDADVTADENSAPSNAADPGITEASSTAATTGVLPEPIAEEELSEGYVPTLDALNMDAVLTKKTGFYYYHAEENEETPANSEEIDFWRKLKEDDSESLAPADLVRAYFAYTIPAGSLNETNQIARYRLPSNLHLTDGQIIAINQNENGIAAQFINYDTLEITDTDKYDLYRGAEAVEGTRTPDQTLADDALEYISAVVKAENVYDEEGTYLGQDLIFIFTPYTIEKNQNTYDSEGNPTSAGHKVTGWFACDFNMDQIDWVESEGETETDADPANVPANTSVEKTAEIHFAAQDNALNIKEISQTLKLVESIETPEDAIEDTMADATEDEAAGEEKTAEENVADETAEDADTEEVPADATEADQNIDNEQSETVATDATTDKETEEEKYSAGTLMATGDAYKITLDYTAEAEIPADSKLHVTEITAESDPEAYEACLKQAQEQVVSGDKETVNKNATRFFDIEIQKDGEKVEPKAPVAVNIQLDTLTENQNAHAGSDAASAQDPTVLHFAQDGVETIDSSKDEKDEVSSIQFEAESFSVYGVVYTVDFHYSVNGKEYEFSLTGGDSVGFSELVGALHLLGENKSENTSEEVKKFIEDIEDIRFSNESLVQVAHITEGITAGGLKQKLGLNPEYAKDLTEAQIEALNSKVYYAPDWVLLSLKPFNTNETITVNMRDGEVFTIDVTDAQISQTFISSKGDNYEIIVTYDELAGIPDDAELRVREFEEGSEEYNSCLRDSVNKLAVSGSDVSYARFFDIEILDQSGKKIEPKTAVQVEISEKNPVEIGDRDTVQIIHFTETETGIQPEVITDVEVSDDNKTVTYEQSSFSVTGKLITGNQPESGEKKYMMIIPYNGHYYIVNNDASLTEVGYDEETDTVSVIEPMLWTFDNGNNAGDKRHIYFNSTASGFNQNYTASDWFRRYLDPKQAYGTLEETDNNDLAQQDKFIKINTTSDGTWKNPDNHNAEVSINHITAANRKPATDATGLTIDSQGRISSNGQYFGIGTDESGILHLVGGKGADDAVSFKFATAYKVPSGDHLHNAVNHIDISIEGDATVRVPLAYGKYYDSNGTQILEVTENTKVTLGHDQVADASQLEITTEDMKRAVIVARDKDGNELDDAFYITGFSQNVTTAQSTNQVRVEGSFLVSDLRGTQYETIDGTKYDGNFWNWQFPDDRYVNAVRLARLENQIVYTVTVVKSVKYHLVHPETGAYLYNSHNEPLYVTIDVPFSISFAYWDQKGNERGNSGNECPPLQNNPTWQQGDIPNHDLSGMDFKLEGNDQTETEAKLPAIEITKVIMDESHNIIELGEPVTTTFEVWENLHADRNSVKDYKIGDKNTNPARDDETGIYDGYTMSHTKTVTVEEGGMEIVYDHNVSNGMYYIVERSDADSLKDTIKDKNNQEYKYVETYIETEYVRRGENYYDDKTLYKDPMHTSDVYTRGDTYKSSPEVVGKFWSIAGPNTSSEERYHEFVEYFVYNIYSKGTKLEVEKKWLPESEKAPEGAEVTLKLCYATRPQGSQEPWPEDENGYQEVTAGTGAFADYPNIVTELTLSEEDNWKGLFADLPETLTISGSPQEVKYYAKEVSATVPGTESSRINIKNGYSTDITFDQTGKEIITNTREQVSLDAEKQWDTEHGTVIPAGAEVTVELRYATRKIKTADGSAVAEIAAWPEDPENKQSYQPVKDKTTGTYALPFVNDPQIDETKIVTELQLHVDEENSSLSWKDVFTGLPKYLIDTDGGLLEVDYYAMETAVTIPDGNSIKDVKDEYLDSTQKTEGSSTDSDGRVVITNMHNVTSLDVDKEWAKGTPEPSDAQIAVSLTYARKKVRDANGQEIQDSSWEPVDNSSGTSKVKFAPVIKSKNEATVTYDDFLVASPDFDQENPGFEPELILKKVQGHPELSWIGTFENLPKYARDSQGNVWELDYNAIETAVIVPGENQEEINEHAENIIDNYSHVEKKTDATGADALTSDGSVIITNTETVTITVKKEWEPQTPPEGAEAVVQLKRYKKDGGSQNQDKTSATVVKVWEDDNNRDGKRPESITVQLYANAEEVQGKTVTLSSQNGWTATISDLDELDDDSHPITYSWREDNTAADRGYLLKSTVTRGKVTTITNKYDPENTSRTATIHWDDVSNQDGFRPESVTVQLMKQVGEEDPVLCEEVTVSGDSDDWTETIDNLPKYENGQEITYSWTAPVLENDKPEAERKYTAPTQNTDGTVTTIQYSHTPEKVSSTVTVVWDDGENADGIRPEEVKVTLSNGQEVTLKASDGWTYTTPENLDKFKNQGEDISYTWTGEYVGGYTSTVQTADNTTTITYSHTPSEPKDHVTVTVHTVLKDPATGKYIDWENNGWNTNIIGIQGTYDQQAIDMNQIASQREGSNYWYTDKDNYALKAPVYFEVDKNSDVAIDIGVYDRSHGRSVWLDDVRSGEAQNLTKGTSVNGNDLISFTTGTRDVDLYVIIGGEEIDLPSHSRVWVAMDYDINAYNNISTSSTGYITHKDFALNSDISFSIKRQPGFTDYFAWNYAYKNNGSWVEVLPNRVVGETNEDVIFNTGIKGDWLIIIYGGPQNKNRIDVTVESAGEEAKSSNNNDIYLSHSLIDYSGGGTSVATIPTNMLSVPSRFASPLYLLKSSSLVNHVDRKNAESGESGNTPAPTIIKSQTITVPEGYSEDTAFDTPAVTLTLKAKEGDEYGWEQSFPAQPKYDEKGEEYIYYVAEISFQPEGYVTESIKVDPDDDSLIIVKNVLDTPQVGSLKITKSVLVNGESTTGKLADGTYTFQIWNADATSQITKKADGSTDIGTLEITVTDGQASPAELLVSDLPAATYIVKETGSTNGATIIDTSVSGYDATHGGIAVTVTPDNTSNVPTAAFVNKYDTTDVSVTKVWNDNNNAKNKRPASLTVILLENGEESGKTVTLDSSNSWTDTISGLPKYKNNAIIDYQWHEGDMPAGYFLTGTSTSGTVTTLTNTLQDYDLKTSYVGVKSWTDEGNKYSTRPDNLEVKLYANNIETSYVPVWAKDTATNQWTYTFADIPVFDANGDVISYTAEETVPTGYKKTSQTQTPTSYSVGTITWEESKNRITPNHQVVWTLQSTIDMAFVAIKPTSNGDVVVWTHRIPTPDEKAAIERVIKVDDALNGCSKRNIVYYTGIGESVYTPHGNVAISYNATAKTITIDFGTTDVWAHFICGQFNGGGGSSYEIGTTSFTNELQTKDLSGTKTWEILGDTIPDNPILTLTRTVTTDDGSGTSVTSAPETVTVADGANTVNLQPVWTGSGNTRTFTYTGLPKFDKNGNEYTYEVAEASFVIGNGDNAVTYTAVKASDGTYTLTPSKPGAAKIVVTQTENAITNTEVKDFEFSKIWRDMNGTDETWPSGKTITVKLNASTATKQKALTDTEVVLGPAPTVLPTDWTYIASADGKKATFKATNLPVKSGDEELTYYVVEVRVEGYKDPIYATSEGTSIVDGNKALDKQQVINTPEDSVELPSAGGVGTHLFYVLGGTLVMAALTLLSKKRTR